MKKKTKLEDIYIYVNYILDEKVCNYQSITLLI